MRQSGADAQRRRFVDAAVGLDHNVALAGAVEKDRDGIAEQRSPHELEAPLEPFERFQRRQLRRRQSTAQRDRGFWFCLSSAFAAKHAG